MDKKIKIIQLKILLVILEIMLVLLIWTLVQVVLLKHDDVAERFRAPAEQAEEVMLFLYNLQNFLFRVQFFNNLIHFLSINPRTFFFLTLYTIDNIVLFTIPIITLCIF